MELEVSEGLLLGLGLVVVVAFSLMGESGGLEVVAEPPLGVVWRGMLDLVFGIFRGVLGGISGEEAILSVALVGEQEHIKWLVTFEGSAVYLYQCLLVFTYIFKGIVVKALGRGIAAWLSGRDRKSVV